MVAPWVTASELATPSNAHAAEFAEAATQILWELSGRRYSGVRTVTETYRQLAPQELDGGLPTPVLDRGTVHNVYGGCETCGCSHLVKLRGQPVREIEAVRFNGERIPLRKVRLLDYSWLSMDDAPGSCWGTCSELTVTYTYGVEPSALAKMAARELANQFIWYDENDDQCVLPDLVTSVSRQGVSWSQIDPEDFLQDGRTGIYTVDLFLKVVNPEKRRRRSRVFSPDLPSGKTRR